MEKRRQLAVLLGMLLISTGIASLGYSMVASWSGTVYIDGGSHDSCDQSVRPQPFVFHH